MQVHETKKNLINMAGDITSYLYGPQMKLAFNLLGSATSNSSDQSLYCVLIPDYNNATLFKNDKPFKTYREDNVVASPGIRRDYPLSGSVYIGLKNPNERDAVTVYVSCYAWRRTQTYHFIETYNTQEKPVYQTLHKEKMTIQTRKIRVNAN